MTTTTTRHTTRYHDPPLKVQLDQPAQNVIASLAMSHAASAHAVASALITYAISVYLTDATTRRTIRDLIHQHQALNSPPPTNPELSGRPERQGVTPGQP